MLLLYNFVFYLKQAVQGCGWRGRVRKPLSWENKVFGFSVEKRALIQQNISKKKNLDRGACGDVFGNSLHRFRSMLL
jgi:hypothetical protein